MNIRKAYNEWSPNYDSDENTTRDLDQRVTEQTFKNLQFDSILEIGCGTGKNTEILSKVGRYIHAIDFSKGMIRQAKSKIRFTNIGFLLADITSNWPCKDRSYDQITCHLILEHIENLNWVFSETNRCLKENGKFFVCELHPFKQYEGKKATVHRENKTVEIPAFVHHLTDYLEAANKNNLTLLKLKEWWFKKEQTGPPRLISFMFTKYSSVS